MDTETKQALTQIVTKINAFSDDMYVLSKRIHDTISYDGHKLGYLAEQILQNMSYTLETLADELENNA
jgi:hypothetical protein